MVLWDAGAAACLTELESSSISFLSAATSPRVTDSSRRRSMAEDGGGGGGLRGVLQRCGYLWPLHDEEVLPCIYFVWYA